MTDYCNVIGHTIVYTQEHTVLFPGWLPLLYNATNHTLQEGGLRFDLYSNTRGRGRGRGRGADKHFTLLTIPNRHSLVMKTANSSATETEITFADSPRVFTAH